MIDLANRIDENFGKSLISQMEDDPAVINRRSQISQRNKINELVRKLPSGLPDSELSALSGNAVGELSWMMLAGLNAGTVSYCSIDKAEPLIERAIGMTFRRAYPVLAWAIQNSVSCHSNTPFGTIHLAQLFNSCATACELGIHLMSRSAGYQSILVSKVSIETGPSDSQEIQPGDRDKAIRIIRDWLVEVKPHVLKISDPYFGPVDLELLKLVLETSPTCSVAILAGEKKQRDLAIEFPYDAPYQEHWRQISQHNPPDTYIVIVGLAKNAESPVHERYLISDSNGLELGISFSGLGRSKVSKISRLSRATALAQGNTLEQYLSCRVRDQDGSKIRYATFSL